MPTTPQNAADQALSLAHLERLTDCFGIVQHASYSIPDYGTGYTTDDNARALVVALKHHRLHGDETSKRLAACYLAFIMFAQRPDGRFHNFVGFDRRPIDEVSSEDCFGRALWALASVLSTPSEPGLVGPAERMLHESLRWIPELEHPRGRAFCITALHRWLLARPEEAPRINDLTRPLADYLVTRYRQHSQPGWDWLLPEMTYANAKLPEALFRAHQITGVEEYLDVARRTMEFLSEKTYGDDSLVLVGNHGWYSYDSTEPPRYDQQPIDAAAMVDAALAGFDATSEPGYLRRAWVALEWFFGRNSKGLPLYDPGTGGCFDGLMEHGVNQNRGAEATVCLLLSQLSVLEARHRISRHALGMPPTDEDRSSRLLQTAP
jgi:hypothetical protein